MASGDTMFTLLPIGSNPTVTVAAPHDEIDDGSAVVGTIPVLDFAGAAANENAEWDVMVPEGYDGGGFSFDINYAMDGGDGSDIQLELRAIPLVEGDAIGSQDLQGQTETDVTDTPSGVAEDVDVAPTGVITHANAGSPAVGNYLRIRITRDFDHAANADDLQLIAAYVTET